MSKYKHKEIIEWGRWKCKGFKFEKRDGWIGYYWNLESTSFMRSFTLYICIIPFFFPLIFQRAGICRDDGYCDVGCPGCERCEE